MKGEKKSPGPVTSLPAHRGGGSSGPLEVEEPAAFLETRCTKHATLVAVFFPLTTRKKRERGERKTTKGQVRKCDVAYQKKSINSLFAGLSPHSLCRKEGGRRKEKTGGKREEKKRKKKGDGER